MSEANAGGVGGLFLLRASKSPPTRLASLATLPANGREGKGQRPHQQMCASVSAQAGVGTGFRKTSCSIKKPKREDDSKRSHPALGRISAMTAMWSETWWLSRSMRLFTSARAGRQ